MVTITTWLGTVLFAFIVGTIVGKVTTKEKCDKRIQYMMNAKLHEALDLPHDENLGD